MGKVGKKKEYPLLNESYVMVKQLKKVMRMEIIEKGLGRGISKV